MAITFTPINPHLHRQHGWQVRHEYHFARGDECAPIVSAELAKVVSTYPLGFVQDGVAQQYRLVAILSLHKGENLFVDAHGQWQAAYIPSVYRAYPFGLIKNTEDGKPLQMGFDRDSGFYREQPGTGSDQQRFFDDEGNVQPEINLLMKFFAACAADQATTQHAVDAIAKADLLVPWLPRFENPQPEKNLLQGLYQIDQQRLAGLPAGTLEELHAAQALPIIYAHLFSAGRWTHLCRLSAVRGKVEAAKTTLDDVFGTGQAETLSFEWLSK